MTRVNQSIEFEHTPENGELNIHSTNEYLGNNISSVQGSISVSLNALTYRRGVEWIFKTFLCRRSYRCSFRWACFRSIDFVGIWKRKVGSNELWKLLTTFRTNREQQRFRINAYSTIDTRSSQVANEEGRRLPDGTNIGGRLGVQNWTNMVERDPKDSLFPMNIDIDHYYYIFRLASLLKYISFGASFCALQIFHLWFSCFHRCLCGLRSIRVSLIVYLASYVIL